MEEQTTTEDGFAIGDNYYFQTITFFFTGRLIQETPHYYIIEDAAWIPECGVYSEFFRKGIPDECEPLDVLVHVKKDSIVAIIPFKNPLPRTQ